MLARSQEGLDCAYDFAIGSSALIGSLFSIGAGACIGLAINVHLHSEVLLQDVITGMVVGGGVGAVVPLIVATGYYAKVKCIDQSEDDELTGCQKLSNCWSRIFSYRTERLNDLENPLLEKEEEKLGRGL